MTASEAGDTVTAGTDMDWPGSPLGPGCPGAPASPYMDQTRIESCKKRNYNNNNINRYNDNEKKKSDI